MRQLPIHALWRILTFFVLAVPAIACAQLDHPPTAGSALGWGEEWRKPANKVQEIGGKISAAFDAKDYRKALEYSEQLFPLMPNSPAPFVLRAGVLFQLQQYDRALADLVQAQRLAQAHGLGRASARICVLQSEVHRKKQDYPAAVNDLHAAIAFDSTDQHALNSLAWLRAVAENPAYRDGAESIRLAQKAVSLGGKTPNYAAMDTLAAGYAETNDFRRAVENEDRALKLSKAQIKAATKLKEFQGEARARLQLYEQHHAYHVASW